MLKKDDKVTIARNITTARVLCPFKTKTFAFKSLLELGFKGCDEGFRM